MTGHHPFSDLIKDFSPERRALVEEKVDALKQEMASYIVCAWEGKLAARMGARKGRGKIVATASQKQQRHGHLRT